VNPVESGVHHVQGDDFGRAASLGLERDTAVVGADVENPSAGQVVGHAARIHDRHDVVLARHDYSGADLPLLEPRHIEGQDRLQLGVGGLFLPGHGHRG
jgi:hypothetical protein